MHACLASCSTCSYPDPSNLFVWRLHTCPCSSLAWRCLAVIQPGQGLFFSSLTQTFRARNCEDNEYGAPSRFYGLTTYPCRWVWVWQPTPRLLGLWQLFCTALLFSDGLNRQYSRLTLLFGAVWLSLFVGAVG